ncbi:MAG: hypothetical protein V4580_18120 [Bacteroidota bacterium]
MKKSKEKTNKSTLATVELRVKEVVKLLINSYSRYEIIQYSSENWRVGERQTDKYIQKAKEAIITSTKKDVSYDFSKAVRRYEDLYRNSVENKDFRTAMNINKELTSLQGLLKAQIEHSGEVKFISSIPD